MELSCDEYYLVNEETQNKTICQTTRPHLSLAVSIQGAHNNAISMNKTSNHFN